MTSIPLAKTQDVDLAGSGSFDQLPVPTVQVSADLIIQWASESFIAEFCPAGYHLADSALGDVLIDVLGQPVAIEPGLVKLHRDNKPSFWGMLILSDPEADGSFILQIVDVDDQIAREDELISQKKVWQTAVLASGQGVWEFYQPENRHFYSDKWREIRGIPPGEKFDESHDAWIRRVHPDDRDRIEEENRKVLEHKNHRTHYEYRERRRDGQWIWILSQGKVLERNADGSVRRIVGTDSDITKLKMLEEERDAKAKEAIDQYVAELRRAHLEAEQARCAADAQSLLDSLTGLANRRAFADLLEGLSSRTDNLTDFGLLLVDLDRFKPVNDTYGHGVGDEVICAAAQVMKGCVGPSDMLARIGGDEFAVIIQADDTHTDEGRTIVNRARTVAARINDEMAKPIKLLHAEIEIGASIGISFFPEHARSPTGLLRAADVALYDVKDNKRGQFAIYRRQMDEKRIERAQLEADVRRAVRSETIEPWFQPLFDLKTGAVKGFEVLARWRHPDKGQISPGEFIPIIEQFDLSRDFGLSMLRRACEVARDWPEESQISYNVSAKGISDPGLPSRVLRVLEEVGMPPERTIVEISERAMVNDLQGAGKVIDRLREAGAMIALDDFGVGYSGLSYLRQLRFDILKLDRSFVRDMAACSQSRKIVMSVLSLAKEFEMKTVAEGIETEETLASVANAGFDIGQGFVYSKAVPAAEAEILFRKPPILKYFAE